MKVEVENQPQGLATLRIELPPEEVRKEWDCDREQLLALRPDSRLSRRAKRPGR